MLNWFSKKSVPPVLTDDVPHALRIQCLMATEDARAIIRKNTTPSYRILGDKGTDVFAEACSYLREELGTTKLPAGSPPRKKRYYDEDDQLANEFVHYFQDCSPKAAIDCLYVLMKLLETHSASRNLPAEHNATQIAAKLNARFREHGSGYQYQNGQFIKVKDTHLHSEVGEPSLQLLGDSSLLKNDSPPDRTTTYCGGYG